MKTESLKPIIYKAIAAVLTIYTVNAMERRDSASPFSKWFIENFSDEDSNIDSLFLEQNEVPPRSEADDFINKKRKRDYYYGQNDRDLFYPFDIPQNPPTYTPITNCMTNAMGMGDSASPLSPKFIEDSRDEDAIIDSFFAEENEEQSNFEADDVANNKRKRDYYDNNYNNNNNIISPFNTTQNRATYTSIMPIPYDHIAHPQYLSNYYDCVEESSDNQSTEEEESSHYEYGIDEESLAYELSFDEDDKTLKRKSKSFEIDDNSTITKDILVLCKEVPGYLPKSDNVIDKLTHILGFMESPEVILLEKEHSSTSSSNPKNHDLLVQKGIIKSDDSFFNIYNPDNSRFNFHNEDNIINCILYLAKNYFNIEGIKDNNETIYEVLPHKHGRIFQLNVKEGNLFRPLYYVKYCKTDKTTPFRGADEVFDNLQLSLILKGFASKPDFPNIILSIKNFIFGENKEDNAILFMPIAQGKTFSKLCTEYIENPSHNHPVFDAAYQIGRTSAVFKKQYSFSNLQVNAPWITLKHPDFNPGNVLYDESTRTVSWIDQDSFGWEINKWIKRGLSMHSKVKSREEKPDTKSAYIEFDYRLLPHIGRYREKLCKKLLEGFYSAWEKKYHSMLTKILISSIDGNEFMEDMEEQEVKNYIKILKELR